MKTRSVVLGEIADTCLGKMLDQRKNKGEYQPYLANVNVRWGSFDLQNLPQMRFLKSEEERYGLKYGDILVCEGGEPGRCAIWKDQIPGMKFQKALHRVRVHEQDVDYRWLFYRFLYAKSRGEFDQYFSGMTTIKHMPGDKIVKIRIDLPEKDYQSKVGDILSAYDDLIENNQKQIKLLEEAAQRFYKEWFVNLRFPGYEDTPIVDGIPEGWYVSNIGNLCSRVNAGGTPSRSKKNYWNNPTIKWFKTGELQDCWLIDSDEMISQEGLDKSSAKIFPKNTILMAIYASPTLGRLGILSSNAACNQAALCLLADESKVSWQWLYSKLYELRDDFNAVAKGAGQQNISADTVKKKEVIIPTKRLMDEFSSLVSPLYDKRLVLQKQVCYLSQARDRLLPKLMSGEIDV